METIVKSFSDGGNKSLQYISNDITRYAENYNLEIVNITNLVQFSFSNNINTECLVVFKKRKNE